MRTVFEKTVPLITAAAEVEKRMKMMAAESATAEIAESATAEQVEKTMKMPSMMVAESEQKALVEKIMKSLLSAETEQVETVVTVEQFAALD